MTMIETIQTRRSCRTYGDKRIEPEKISELRLFLASNRKSPFGGRVRFLLLDFDELEKAELKRLTTYGVIRGARQFIAGAVAKQEKAMEDYGYGMEKNILKATSMGLGTCWLGGTFGRGGFADRIGLADGEWLPAITPVGYSGEKRSAVERMFRWVAASDKRKPWHELFYLRDIGTLLEREDAGVYETPLESVRLAPSASNKQPWRIIRDGGRNAFHFYLKRTPGYEKMFKEIRLQNVDMGIAMSHFELSAGELGITGEWQVRNPPINAGAMEYVASWIAHGGA